MIDFHCHLDLYPDPVAVRDECNRRGLDLLSVTTTPSAWPGTSALASGSNRIRTALGLHPAIAHERRQELPLFDRYLDATRFVGEVGLDGSPECRDHWSSQVAVFEHVLARSSEVGGRILSIHSRRAAGAVLDCIEKHPSAGTCVLHWFSGNHRDLDRAIEAGCWFSVGPAMLLSDKGRELAKRMPRERLLTESDGPFAQADGRPAMPWDVGRALDGLGSLWAMSTQDVGGIVVDNFRTLLADRAETLNGPSP